MRIGLVLHSKCFLGKIFLTHLYPRVFQQYKKIGNPGLGSHSPYSPTSELQWVKQKFISTYPIVTVVLICKFFTKE